MRIVTRRKTGSDLGEVAVFGAGPRHLGGVSGAHRQTTVPPRVIGARQLVLFVGHAAVMGAACIGCLAVQLRAPLHHWTTLPLDR